MSEFARYECSSAPRPTTTTPSRSTTTAAPSRTSTTTTTSALQIGRSRAESAVAAFYAELPGSTSTAYDTLGPRLSSKVSSAEFRTFWTQFTRIELRSNSASTDGSSVEVTVVFYRPTCTTVEDHTLGLVTESNYQPLINSDTMENTRTY